MSQREEKELKPHKLLPDGKFDLDQWNEDYWNRFENMLRWTAERDIIVQIEVWDRFDYSTNYWETSPWNPGNNTNYTYEQTGFAAQYPKHSSQDLQPFFHTIKAMPRYNKKLDLIRAHQEAFVARMLSYSLSYGHVLYCMNNETSTPAEWGQYWIEFIKARAADKGVSVCTTDMFDDAFQAEKAKHTPLIFNDAEHYMFADISQVNSRNYDEAHWDSLQWLLRTGQHASAAQQSHQDLRKRLQELWDGRARGRCRTILAQYSWRLSERPVSPSRLWQRTQRFGRRKHQGGTSPRESVEALGCLAADGPSLEPRNQRGVPRSETRGKLRALFHQWWVCGA